MPAWLIPEAKGNATPALKIKCTTVNFQYNYKTLLSQKVEKTTVELHSLVPNPDFTYDANAGHVTLTREKIAAQQVVTPAKAAPKAKTSAKAQAKASVSVRQWQKCCPHLYR